ncbi:hypothetical protein EG327_004888 [Venturia inaequalis]|uniref:Borealin N-terminal domain-containing protein n=2 Tax=Venturia inaequalis TaxID=5025 RepID=A0A8H3VA05_VENIN|nr:hypothetical protein EG327_004888 [Venturia inaequalis]
MELSSFAVRLCLETTTNTSFHTPTRSHIATFLFTIATKTNIQSSHLLTERARKLRAQYALHAQGLRSRLEMRINRVPKQLRTTNIAELIDQYSEHLEPPSKRPLPVPQAATVTSKAAQNARPQPAQQSNSARPRGTKRSSEMVGGSDKENGIEIPKKRSKAAQTGGPVRAVRTASRLDPSKVLSPKSHNSRQLPQSPFKRDSPGKPLSPGKSYLARPVSPVKPGTVAAATASLANLVAPAERTRPAGRTAAKQTAVATGSVRERGRPPVAMAPPAVPPKTGRGRAASDTSDTSTGTTVVKTKRTVVKKTVVRKVASGVATGAHKRTVSKKESIPAPSATGAGGRVLRARR